MHNFLFIKAPWRAKYQIIKYSIIYETLLNTKSTKKRTQYDFTSGDFHEHILHERTITTSDGIEHDRDALAAFNMKFVRKETVSRKKKVKKAAENFNNESMAELYQLFCQMENKK